MFKKIKNKKGFTLTELIVVIVIIGILAAVLIPSLTGYITKAKKSADEQKVASLNTLLIEVQVNETDFNDALELKEYLEDEMDYDGDYSLKVEGSYMWYDSMKRKVVIINEDDEKMNLSTTAAVTLRPLANEETFEFVTDGKKLKSPEGLMQYSNGKEVWLIGGNGYLFDLVEEIRNIGNSGEGKLEEYNNLSNSIMKTVFEKFFEGVFFSGTEGTFCVDTDGNITSSTNEEGREEVKAYKETNLVELFHKEVIESNIESINEKLKKDGAPVELLLNNHTVTVKITKSNDISKSANAVYEVIKLLKDNGCDLGYVFPKRYESISEYEKVLNNIIKGYETYNENSEKTISEELNNYLSKTLGEEKINIDFMEQFYKVDLSKIGSSEVSELVSNFLPIIVALNLEEKQSDEKTIYNFDISDTNLSVDMFKNKEAIRLIGKIESDKYGRFNAQYDFVFDTSSIDKNNE